jgi:hypothetical protein
MALSPLPPDLPFPLPSWRFSSGFAPAAESSVKRATVEIDFMVQYETNELVDQNHGPSNI